MGKSKKPANDAHRNDSNRNEAYSNEAQSKKSLKGKKNRPQEAALNQPQEAAIENPQDLAAADSAAMDSAAVDKTQLFKVPLKYGISGAGISIILFLTLYFSDAEPVSSIRLFDFVLLPLFIFFTIKELRDYQWGGKIAYWQGMTAGFVTYALISIISALFIYLMLTQIDPALFIEHKKENIAILTEDSETWVEQLGQQGYDKALIDIRATTPLSLAADDFFKKIIIGFLITTVIAIFLKRQ